MKKSKPDAFTLIELVIVIAVIAILAAVLIPTFVGIINKSKESKELQDLNNVYTEYIITNNITSVNNYIIKSYNNKYYPIINNNLIYEEITNIMIDNNNIYYLSITIDNINYVFTTNIIDDLLYTKNDIYLYNTILSINDNFDEDDYNNVCEFYNLFVLTSSQSDITNYNYIIKTSKYYYLVLNNIVLRNQIQLTVGNKFNIIYNNITYNITITDNPMFSYSSIKDIYLYFTNTIDNNITTINKYKDDEGNKVIINKKGTSNLFLKKINTTHIIFDNSNNINYAKASIDLEIDPTGRIKTYLEQYDDIHYKLYVLSEYKIYANPDSSYYFDNLTNLIDITFNNFDTSLVTNMSYMFNECNNLINLNLNNFDTLNVTNMSYMFYKNNNLTNLNISSFNTNNCTNFNYMFAYNNKLDNIFFNKNIFIINGTHDGILLNNNTYKYNNNNTIILK